LAHGILTDTAYYINCGNITTTNPADRELDEQTDKQTN